MSDWGFDRLNNRGSSGRQPGAGRGRGAGMHGNVHGFGGAQKTPARQYHEEYEEPREDEVPPPPTSYGSGQRLGVHDTQSWNEVLRNNDGRVPPSVNRGRDRGSTFSRTPSVRMGGPSRSVISPNSSPPSSVPRGGPSRSGPSHGGPSSSGPSRVSNDNQQVDEYTAEIIINNITITRALIRQIAEWFDEGNCCSDIMDLSAQQYHGVASFQRGMFDPEVVVAALAMEHRLEVGYDDGTMYSIWADDVTDRERGIGRGFVRYWPSGNRNGVPVMDLRMTHTRYAMNGFFRGLMQDVGGDGSRFD